MKAIVQRSMPLPLAAIGLVLGMLAGLERMGWSISSTGLQGSHGLLMTGTFLGTLITLEKCILLPRAYMFFPLASGSSLVFFFLNMPAVGSGLLATGSIGLMLCYAHFLRKHSSLYHWIALGGAVCWSVANFLSLAGVGVPQLFQWFLSFILFTIVAERLELTRFLPVPAWAMKALYALLVCYAATLVIPQSAIGSFVAGLTMCAIGVWLLRFDLITITWRKSGQVGYTGKLLAIGYMMLFLSGLALMVMTRLPFGYDLMLHLFFIGFTMMMIFAHGPIIFPGILGLSIRPWKWPLYVPATITLASIVLRAIGDLRGSVSLRIFSGTLTMAGILLFLLLMAGLMIYASLVGRKLKLPQQ